SAGTVMCGLGLMGTAEFAKVRYAGPAIALSLGVALVAALTLTPALLRLLGQKVFWPGKPPRPTKKLRWATEEPEGLVWGWLSRFVSRHPVVTWSAAVLVLLPLALLGLKVRPNYRPTGELSATSDSVLGLGAIQRHFSVVETGPLTVLLSSSTDWTSPTDQEEIDHLSRCFAGMPGVAEVRSLTQPLGKPVPGLLASRRGARATDMFAQARLAALTHYVAAAHDGGATRHV